MFKLAKSPIPIELGQVDHAVIDLERNVWMRAEHGSRAGREYFSLRWEDRVIPFIAIPIGRSDPKGPFVWQVGGIGDPPFGKLPPYNFRDSEEERLAEQLIAEAMIIYGGFYNGETEPDGTYVVKIGSAVYTKRSFQFR